MLSFILVIAIVNLALGYGLAIYLGSQGLAIGAGTANFPSWHALSSRLKFRQKQTPSNGNLDADLGRNSAAGLPFPDAPSFPGPDENELLDDPTSAPFDLSADDSPFRPMAGPSEDEPRPAAPHAASLSDRNHGTADPVAASGPPTPADDLPSALPAAAAESPDRNALVAPKTADQTPPAATLDTIVPTAPAPPQPSLPQADANSTPAPAPPTRAVQSTSAVENQASQSAQEDPEEQLAQDAMSLAAETEAVVSDPEMLAGIEAFRAQLAEMHQQPSD